MLHLIDGRLQPVMAFHQWRGRSGRVYSLAPESLERFALAPNNLYLIALRDLVLWVGSAEDLIGDYQSRARFRLALDCADRVLRIEDEADEVERLTIAWDLEGGEPLLALSAA